MEGVYGGVSSSYWLHPQYPGVEPEGRPVALSWVLGVMERDGETQPASPPSHSLHWWGNGLRWLWSTRESAPLLLTGTPGRRRLVRTAWAELLNSGGTRLGGGSARCQQPLHSMDPSLIFSLWCLPLGMPLLGKLGKLPAEGLGSGLAVQFALLPPTGPSSGPSLQLPEPGTAPSCPHPPGLAQRYLATPLPLP